ncbi:MAG TPA: hypothetical protein VFG28_14240 [Syntrophales bacterium]|nr:hypothetical protein [Syntrophales bacterium]
MTTKGKEGKKASPKKTAAKPGKKEPAITMQDALQIAQAYLADKGGAFGISGVSDRVPEELVPFFASDGKMKDELEGCWIVECSLDPFLVVHGGTMLIGISKKTGDILYAGILNVA